MKSLALSTLTKPLLVGTLTSRSSIAAQLKRAQSASVDVLEVRLDTFDRDINFVELIHSIKKNWKKPLILTLRSWKEQGKLVSLNERQSNSERLKIIGPLLPLVDFVDVEIQQRDFARVVTQKARAHHVKVIHSVHRFNEMGKLSSVSTLSETSRKLKGTIFKVAVAPRSEEELQTFLQWGLSLKNPHRVLIAMGKIGEISRYIGFSFGSILTFGHLGSSTAPGQPSVKELRKGIDVLYGQKRQSY